MPAQISEVQAYKAIDGSVHDTVAKAHQRNLKVLCYRLFGNNEDEPREDRLAADALYSRLTAWNAGWREQSRLAIAALAKELE